MTRIGRLLLLLYLVVFTGLAYLAAVDIDRGVTSRGIAVYAAAVVVALAAGREIHHNGAAQAVAIRDGRPRPHTFPSDLDAIMRAELAGNCDCALWWTTFGAFHDWACPQLARNIQRHEES